MCSKRTSERCERTSERLSEWPITNTPISRVPESLCKDTSFAVGLQGVAPEDADQVLEVIDATWRKIVDEGFEEKDIDAILHKVELQVR